MLWEIIEKMCYRLGHNLRPSGGGVFKPRPEDWAAFTLRIGGKALEDIK